MMSWLCARNLRLGSWGADVAVELSPQTPFCLGALQLSDRDAELAIAQRADTYYWYGRKPLDDAKITYFHRYLSSLGGQRTLNVGDRAKI